MRSLCSSSPPQIERNSSSRAFHRSGELSSDRAGVVVQLRQDPPDRGGDVGVVPHLGRARQEALTVAHPIARQQPGMARRVVAHVDGHPRPVRAGPLEDLAVAFDHPGDQVLPRSAGALVGGQDRADVVGRADRHRIPLAVRRGGVGEGVLGDDLAHRVALPALGRALRVGLVGFTVLVDDRPADELGDVGLGDDRGEARRHHDAAHRARRLDAGDDVVARAAHVLGVVVRRDVRDVGHAVATAEDLVEAPGFVEIGAVQRQSPGGVGVHRLQERDPFVADVADAGAHPVALIEQRLHDVPADEPGRPGDCHGAEGGNCWHRASLAQRGQVSPARNRCGTSSSRRNSGAMTAATTSAVAILRPRAPTTRPQRTVVTPAPVRWRRRPAAA